MGYGKMLEEGEIAGTFKFGPRALAAAERDVKAATARVQTAQQRLATRSAGPRATPESIARAQRSVNAAQKRLDKAVAARDEARKFADQSKHYAPHIWETGEITQRRAEFVERLSVQLDRADGIVDGVAVAQADRPLIMEAAEALDRAELERIAAAKGGTPMLPGAQPAASPAAPPPSLADLIVPDHHGQEPTAAQVRVCPLDAGHGAEAHHEGVRGGPQ